MQDPVIDDSVLVNLLASMVMCLLTNITQDMPYHAKKARCIRKVEESIVELAKLNAAPLNEELVTVGIRIYNRCLEELQEALEYYLVENAPHKQLEFNFHEE